jgi:hypothetical protein
MTIANALSYALLIWFGALAMLVAGRILTGQIDCSGLLVGKQGDSDIAPERVVSMGLMPAVLGYYAIHALNTGAVAGSSGLSMPDLPENLVTLLTGGNGLYLAGKLARARG